MTNGLSHPYRMDESTFMYRGIRSDFSFLLARLQEVQKSYCSHPGRTRSRSRHTLLKFSRSLYLDNQLSESIHTWTIGTL